MNKKQFELVEQLNQIREVLDIFSDEPYEKRIKNVYYNELMDRADSIAIKINNLN